MSGCVCVGVACLLNCLNQFEAMLVKSFCTCTFIRGSVTGSHWFSSCLKIPSLLTASAMRRSTLGQVAQHQFMTKPTVTWGCAPTTRGSFGREKSPQHNQLNICCISLLYCYIHILEAYRQNMTASVMPFREISTWPSSHLPSDQRGKQHPSGFQQPRAKAIQRVLGGDTWNGWVAHTWELNG